MFVFKSFIFQTPSEKEVDLVKYLETAEETCQSSQSSPTRLGKITYFLYLIFTLLMQVVSCPAVKSMMGLWSIASLFTWSPTSLTNKEMHCTNGNIRQLHFFHQNIPGTTRQEQVAIHIDNIIDLYRPHVLFLGEIDSDTVSLCCPENYIFIPGKQLNSNKIRISCLVHQNVKYKAVDILTEIPTVCLEIDTWKLLGIYREWSKAGDAATNTIPCQLQRLENFCVNFKSIKGKKIIIGDVNINALPSDTGHYQRLEPLKELLAETMIDSGMV